MRWIVIASILIMLIVGIVGCEKKGYEIIIKTDQIKDSELMRLEEILINEGFETIWRERQLPNNEVYTFLEKKLSDKKYLFVEIYIHYIKDRSNTVIQHPIIRIQNWFKGSIISEIKIEIDHLGDLVYQELVNMVGKEKVIIERKEWGPPVFY